MDGRPLGNSGCRWPFSSSLKCFFLNSFTIFIIISISFYFFTFISLSLSFSLSLVLLSLTLKANTPVMYFNNSCRVQHSSRQTMTKCAQRVDEFVLALPLRLGQIIPSSGAHCWFWSGFWFLLGFFFSFFLSFLLSLFLFFSLSFIFCWPKGCLLAEVP